MFNLIEATSNVCAMVAIVTAAMAATVSVRLALPVVVAADMTRFDGAEITTFCDRCAGAERTFTQRFATLARSADRLSPAQGSAT